MHDFVELPIVDPVYQTYHYQGNCTAVISGNPSIRNWILNEIMILTCDRKFLAGFTTPHITIQFSTWSNNPYLEKYAMTLRFTKGYVNTIIREMLNKGYYVVYSGADDFYIPGKTWYRQRHFSHDGLICGYNQKDKTYCLYAYDNNWVYQKFWIPQKSFNRACAVMVERGTPPYITAVKPMAETVPFSPETAYRKIVEYLDSSFEKYPMSEEGSVSGIIVHAYIAEYIAKLHNGSIPYERMDWRVFRVIWEHKKAMLERIKATEQALRMEGIFSNEYQWVVTEANSLRMLYASYHMKRRDSVLPKIQKRLLDLMEEERDILTDFTKTVKKVLEK